MKAVNRHSLIGFALGAITAGSLNLVLTRNDRQPDEEQGGFPVSGAGRSRSEARSSVRGDASRDAPMPEQTRGFLSAAGGNHAEAWKRIEESALTQSEKDIALQWLLKDLCDSGQFDLGFELVTTKMGYGQRRTFLIAHLFGNPSIPVKRAFEASEALATGEEKTIALSGISCALNSQGLKGCGMDGRSVLALKSDEAAAFGSGIGRHLDLMEGSREFKAGVVKDDLSYFRNLAKQATTPAEREALDIAKYSYLSLASGVDSKQALEEFTSAKFDQVPVSREWTQAAYTAMNSLVSRHPVEILDHLRAGEGQAPARLFGSAVGIWAERDLDAASAWMTSNTGDLSQTQVDFMASSLVEVSLRLGDKEAARGWQAQIKNPQLAAATGGLVK